MQIFTASLLVTYLHFFLLVNYGIMGTILFTTWLEFFKQDTIDSLSILIFTFSILTLTEKVTLVVATLLWPLVVPLAYLELISKNRVKL